MDCKTEFNYLNVFGAVDYTQLTDVTLPLPTFPESR